MAVGDAGLESCRIAGPQHDLAVVFTQHDLSGQHVHELIFGDVPMALRRGGAWLQGGEIDAELVESDGVAEPLAYASEHDLTKWLRISGQRIRLEVIDFDLRHARCSAWSYVRSMIVAVPMPMPMHRVTSAVPALRRS